MKMGTPGLQFHFDFGDPLMKSGTPVIPVRYAREVGPSTFLGQPSRARL